MGGDRGSTSSRGRTAEVGGDRGSASSRGRAEAGAVGRSGQILTDYHVSPDWPALWPIPSKELLEISGHDSGTKLDANNASQTNVGGNRVLRNLSDGRNVEQSGPGLEQSVALSLVEAFHSAGL